MRRRWRACGSDLPANRGIDVPAALLNRLEVEARPRQQAVADAENNDTAHHMRRSVPPRAPVFPLAPDLVAVDRRAQHLRGDVRDGGEDLLPIPADLLAAGEAALRVSRRVIPVVRREAGHQRIHIVCVRRRARAARIRSAATSIVSSCVMNILHNGYSLTVIKCILCSMAAKVKRTTAIRLGATPGSRATATCRGHRGGEPALCARGIRGDHDREDCRGGAACRKRRYTRSSATRSRLVRAIRDKALAGEGPVHAERRSDRMQASENDPRDDHSETGASWRWRWRREWRPCCCWCARRRRAIRNWRDCRRRWMRPG